MCLFCVETKKKATRKQKRKKQGHASRAPFFGTIAFAFLYVCGWITRLLKEHAH
jgi:hypothetical protein